MPDRSNLTKAERAVLLEIERQFEGCALVSYAWLRLCTSPGGRATRPEYPSYPRALDRALKQLINRGFVLRLRTQDRGAFYGLAETWSRIPADVRTDIQVKDLMARGSKTEVSLLVLGPAALPDDLRQKLWGGPSGPAEPGVVFEFRGLKLGPGGHHVNVGPLPQMTWASEYRVASNVRLVNMVYCFPE